MVINGKSFESWTLGDIAQLVGNMALRESDTLDYKQEFDINEEFKKDVCSFANNRGGYILYGVAEQQRDDAFKTGVAGSLIGIENIGADAFELAIGNALASSIEPKKPDFSLRVIPLRDERRCVLALCILEGNDKPYCPKQSRQFFIRGNNNKEPMSYFQIRDLFLAQSGGESGLRWFLRERDAFLNDPDTPGFLGYGALPYLAVYYAPAGAFSAQGNRYDVAEKSVLDAIPPLLQTTTTPWSNCRVIGSNADGLLLARVSKFAGSMAHIQLFRSGVVEFVSVSPFSSRGANEQSITRHALSSLGPYVAVCDALGIEPPAQCVVALHNTRNNKLYKPRKSPFDRQDYRGEVIELNDYLPDTLRDAESGMLRELGYMFGSAAR